MAKTKTTLVPRWDSLLLAYGSLMAKAAVLLTLAVPVSKIAGFHSIASNYFPSLLGALIVAAGTAITKLSVPKLLTEFPNAERYAQSILQRSTNGHFDVSAEFGLVRNDPNDSIEVALRDLSCKSDQISNLMQSTAWDGDQSLYYKAHIKYAYLCLQKLPLRSLVTLALVVGTVLMYLPLIKAIAFFFVQTTFGMQI
jgi:hypothetical protein